MPRTAARAALGLFVIITAAACGTHPAATAPAAATDAAAATHAAAAAPTCKQQYHTWRYSPAGKQLKADLGAVASAGNTDDIPVLLAALKTAGADATAMENHPAPACADPHGYWKQIFARLRAAGDNAGTAGGLTGLLLAEAPLKAIPGLEKKLAVELKRTT
jgi:hypothetical protein